MFEVFVLIAMLACSAFFSAAETAITSMSRLKTKHLIELGPLEKTLHLQWWLKHPARVLTTILLYNTAANIIASAVATKIAIHYFDDYGLGIAAGLSTVVVLVFCEIIPKSYGKSHTDWLGRIALGNVHLFYRLAYPLIWALAEGSQWLLLTLGFSKPSFSRLTEEELEFMINEGSSQGAIKDIKKEMISGVFDFDETKVREILTPRTDVQAVGKTACIRDVAELILATGHSRIPVYEDSVDNVVGVVFAKDILAKAANDKAQEGNVTEIMREPVFVPESNTIMDVFKELKRHKVHIAVVIDEHGGTAGIVTMEDILEEIVGEIEDEFDTEEAKFKKIDKDTYEVAGSVNINEFAEFFDLNENYIEETDHESDTVGGFVMHLLKDFPKAGQKVQFANLNLEVAEVGRRRKRIEKVRIVRMADSESIS